MKMDVDGEVEGKLAQQFGCMGTVDKEVLVRQFQQVLGPNQQLPADSCAFFLDMNNWNLQAALGSFYDFGNTNGGIENGTQPLFGFGNIPAMVFVKDVTVGEGESVPPSTRFLKSWRLRNPGPEHWPPGCFLKHIEGQLLAGVDSIQVGALEPGAETDVATEMQSPGEKGIYQSRWQLNTPNGVPFGESIWCIIVVEDSGLLGITQQLASTSCGHQLQQLQNHNPFALQSPPGYDPKNEPAITIINSPDSIFAHTEHQSPSSSVMDASLLAVRGSPIPSCLSTSESEPPDAALYEAVAAAFPQPFDRPFARSSIPVDIPPTSPWRRSTPEVPPCTPCTPPLGLLSDHQGNLRLCTQSPSKLTETDMQQL